MLKYIFLLKLNYKNFPKYQLVKLFSFKFRRSKKKVKKTKKNFVKNFYIFFFFRMKICNLKFMFLSAISRYLSVRFILLIRLKNKWTFLRWSINKFEKWVFIEVSNISFSEWDIVIINWEERAKKYPTYVKLKESVTRRNFLSFRIVIKT